MGKGSRDVVTNLGQNIASPVPKETFHETILI